MKRLFLFGFFLVASGCTPHPSPTAYTRYGIVFGDNLPVTMQQGIYDGCETARGYYRKDHRLFRYDDSYKEGWFKGRNACEPLRAEAR